MKQTPQMILVSDLLDDWPKTVVPFVMPASPFGVMGTFTEKWVLVRPQSSGGILTRFRLAYRVFTGECDVLKLDSQ